MAPGFTHVELSDRRTDKCKTKCKFLGCPKRYFLLPDYHSLTILYSRVEFYTAQEMNLSL